MTFEEIKNEVNSKGEKKYTLPKGFENVHLERDEELILKIKQTGLEFEVLDSHEKLWFFGEFNQHALYWYRQASDIGTFYSFIFKKKNYECFIVKGEIKVFKGRMNVDPPEELVIKLKKCL